MLLTGYWRGGSSYAFRTLALRLDPQSPSPRILGKLDAIEMPGGYTAYPSKGTVLFWYALPPAGHAHVADRVFRFVTVRLEPARWRTSWTYRTRRAHPWNLDEERDYRLYPDQDPLREIGTRWPRRWCGLAHPRPRGTWH